MLAMILAVVLDVSAAAAPIAPPARPVAEGVTLIPGAILPERGPDGNTVIFDAPDGLVVVDTGRHVWHSDAILAYAERRQRPIAAIINTHWHLDHSSGNVRLKARYPRVSVHTTRAIDRAIAPGGFLIRNRNDARFQEMLADPNVSDVRKEEIRNGMTTMAQPDALRPDIAIERSQRRYPLAGRRFDVHITDGAVTDADVWLYERRTRVAVLGDLVTFPAPFFETACPDAWRRALDEVWATPFRIAIPGHGEPMNRDQFNAYRTAFNAFMDCVEGDSQVAGCASVWVDGVAQFLADDAARDEAREYAIYYVGYLRDNGGRAPDCLQR
jgi:glyoxylase-like metal-dependent hydrolase (beta-lactamase superfamily II)